MIVASLLLVIVAAATLVVGLFNPDNTTWVWTSIACCVAAGILLIAGVMRSRPKRKPVLQSGTDQPASWAGAATWAGAEPEQAAAPPQTEGVRVVGEPMDGDGAQMAPAAPDDTQDVWAPEPAAAPAPEMAPAVAEPIMVEPEPAPEVVATKSTARKSSAAAAGAAGASDTERVNAALAGISGVGPAKRQSVVEAFPTYRKLRAASVDKLAEVPGISKALAERIHTAIHS